MFGFTQTTGGRYFGPEPSETDTAAELKQSTAVALGNSKHQEQLISAKEWFHTYFANTKRTVHIE